MQIDSSITHIRPRFKFTIEQNSELTLARIRDLIQDAPANIHGQIVSNHVILDIVGDEKHYWSPQLNFRVEKEEENEEFSIIAGLIGPRPEVWTLFMFIYFITGLTGFIISSYGVSKWLMGEFSHFIWVFPIAVLFMLTAYKAGKYGENLAQDQIDLLKGFVAQAIRK